MTAEASRRPRPPVAGGWQNWQRWQKVIHGLDIFDLPNDIGWTGKAPLHKPRVWGAAFPINGKIWLCGGIHGHDDGYNPQMEVYDPATNSWTVQPGGNPFGWLAAVVATPSGKIYGLGGDPPKRVVEYDPATSKFVKKADMPMAVNKPGVVARQDGRILVLGGLVEPDMTVNTVQEFNPVTNTWMLRAPMPTGRFELAAVRAANGKIYAMGGFVWGGSTELATVEAYDPVSNSWSQKAPMPTARRCLAAVCADNTRIYAIGGLHSCASMAVVEEYNPATNSWSAKSPMPTGRWGLAAAALGGRLYAIGGYLRTGAYQSGNPNVKALSVVEAATLPT